jgi:hypothetical protein
MCGVIGASSRATVSRPSCSSARSCSVACSRFLQHVHQRHHLGDGGVEFVVLPNILAGLLDRQVDRAAYGLLLIAQGGNIQFRNGTRLTWACARRQTRRRKRCAPSTPESDHSSAHVRRRGEHHEQAAGVGAELIDHRLWVDTVVLRLGHLLGAADFHRQAVAGELRADDLGLAVTLDS